MSYKIDKTADETERTKEVNITVHQKSNFGSESILEKCIQTIN